MSTVQFVKDHLYLTHGWFLGTVKGLTEEQTNYLPPGTAHPIGAVIQHVLRAEDDTVNRRIRGNVALWDRDGWEERTGLTSLARADEAAYRAYRMAPDALDEYRKAVWAATDAYLEELSDTELLRELAPTGGRPSTIGSALRILLNHSAIHVGEIAAIKGIQGVTGMPM